MSHWYNYTVVVVMLFSLLASFFVSRIGIDSELWIVSLIFMSLFALPSFISIVRLNRKRAFLTLTSLSVASLTIESFAIKTGFPYGAFYYQDSLGPKILGLAPLAVPLGWIPLVLGSYALVRRLRIPFTYVNTAVLLVLLDMVIDPGSFALGIWIWRTPGAFYGVPLQNFVGWFFSGLIGAWIAHFFIGKIIQKAHYSMIILSLVGPVSFWTGIAFFKALWIPVMLGCCLLWLMFFSVRVRSQQ
ncbi:carotenoid biosynthesis protein [Candidatus Roizmanbacteria bacterium]|nr:MAG: carotenoid biosynthesis protein [Candidatus Roizmanbacteria bacterium]